MSAVKRVPGKVSGAWLFVGTRIPVKALFEDLESGATVDEFIEWFPRRSRAPRSKAGSSTPNAALPKPEVGGGRHRLGLSDSDPLRRRTAR
jgi:hypothetical protein